MLLSERLFSTRFLRGSSKRDEGGGGGGGGGGCSRPLGILRDQHPLNMPQQKKVTGPVDLRWELKKKDFKKKKESTLSIKQKK